MIIFLFGAPGAGKGTQAKILSEKLNILHLSTGDILRDELLQESKLSQKLKVIINSGSLVSDELINDIISKRITKKDCKKGFIFDGYPRTINQANYIDIFFQNNQLKINYLFEITLNQNETIKRINKRSFEENRADDSIDTIKTRLNKYFNDTVPVLKHYKSTQPELYFTVKGDQEISIIHSEIMKKLEK
ncbi:MAG: adenylate kinase [Alphaproteobacteria bacterium MarineAlpha5_Bin9]|nr:MAG: adenylate kinase [Alphaproteobacteria bacterium MarineAlpha5_Bin9]|tara:strand:- start:19188 stop:19757 length:570 start_codon:yes stop_codon:yes gene_type:complete